MYENTRLWTFFESNFPINKEGLEELFLSFKCEKFKKATLILRTCQTENHLRFLNHGVVREYYTSEEKETNINFYDEGEFISDFLSFCNNIKSKKNQECLTNVEILTLDKSKFHKLLEKYECGKSIVDITFQQLLEKKESFEYNRLTKSPEQLYQQIIDYKPKWLMKIPQYHIASYLGVTPETLSRIRKRIS